MPIKRRDGTVDWIHQKSAAAGVKRSVAARELTHQRYVNVLEGREFLATVEQTTIQSRKHKLYTVKQSRVGLFPADDKRWVNSDHSTRALGHHLNEEWDTYDNILHLMDTMEEQDRV